ncbi:BrxA/BrxB family bacilliredoxin [Fictibacillus sp. WQ 8-8]|uniref:BrxA/BrxB family bacilliredoxin n=1 Tax=Fictibacillus marinisediminis TaxID=2878389 RepID=A0A9X1XAP3_9BACL|nr:MULTISPECIES: BrxA/BrxB family bacilliredoxin [Fictibacillus]MCK6257179.1 BrxA/BrxB family bacilliredoxin [Fictibacillus marinisediminis]MCQ6267219.1 BrxA/BrxB family bacilliredoxin [Fictibacillus sp. WQ 8-8]MED2973132.1 BrxA/BrxB family bacilliredoxin [Fictibacillus sp. B-59209]UZJ76988.1 BrxA/BrxB family bacilliredoxin [Fictibacillus sp. KU28468]
MNAYEEYMRQMAQPMRNELTNAGFSELTTPEEVDRFMENTEGTSLVFINSVCGCAAGLARPSAIYSLNHAAKPDNIVTVFAGQDKEATARMRDYFEGYPPSSPSMALLKGKEVVHFIHRHDIENHSAEEIVENLVTAYEKNNK